MTLWGIELWGAALVFARVGAMIMLLPGLGEPTIPPRARLGLALAVTICIAPTLQLPGAPTDAWAGGAMVMGEVLIGLILGGAARMLMSSLATAGQIMGLESGLAFAQTADPTSANAGQVFSVFLSLMGATLIFATGLHHLFLRGMAGTYELFTPGAPTPVGDAADLAVEMTSRSFRVAFQITAPVVVAGLIFRLGLGALARLIPTIQVFFVALPLQVLGAFIVIALGLSVGMLVWLDSLSDYARSYS
jgi:flagellar biosynthetic protein FliR